MRVSSCVPCHASKGLRHGATTHDCSCGIGITLKKSRQCSEYVQTHIVKPGTCHTAIAASPPACAMMSFGLGRVVCAWGFILSLGLTTHAPVAHSSSPWSVSLAQRSGFGAYWPWRLIGPARPVCLQRCSRVCWCVCVRLVFACPPMYAHQHTARMATTSLD